VDNQVNNGLTTRSSPGPQEPVVDYDFDQITLYPLVEHAIPFPDGSHPMYDLMGKDAVVFRHSKDQRRRRRRPAGITPGRLAHPDL
jgi:hypothetical protein